MGIQRQNEDTIITTRDLKKGLTLGWWQRRKAIQMFEKRFGKQATVKEIIQWTTDIQRPNLAKAFIGRDLELTKVFLEAGVRLGVIYPRIMAQLCELGYAPEMAYLIGEYHGESRAQVDLYALAWVGI